MFQIICGTISLLLAVGALFVPGVPQNALFIKKIVAAFFGFVGFIFFLSTSFVHVGQNEVGHLNKIYGASDLPTGKIIATKGEKGPQADILGPGFHFSPLINIIYDVEFFETVQIPEGFYGQLVAKDGQPLPEGSFIASGFDENEEEDMLNATYFLQNGGYRGPQETVLKPGTYRINYYLFDVTLGENTRATIIPAGHVGVVKSNIGQKAVCREQQVKTTDREDGALSVTLVPRGCVGIWNETLLPGAYYLNRNAYEVTVVDTRVQTWEYKGGYTKRIIDLSVDQEGQISQTERTVENPVPDNAADPAVFVKIEGWDIPVELRALVQVDSKTAPVVVGAVGGLNEIEDRILTPTIRSIVRNVAGDYIRVPVRGEDGKVVEPIRYETRPTRVLDLIENRDAIETRVEELIQIEGRKAGIEIREIRIGEPSIPPELLVSRLREQLAGQLMETYERETEAQKERIQTEQARATANQQNDLVTAQIAVQVAEQTEKERETLGRAERKFLENLAQGQSAQANVLGEDRVAMLQALDKVLATFTEKPELIGFVNKLVPNILVSGDGGNSMAGAAAILGDALKTNPPAGDVSLQR